MYPAIGQGALGIESRYDDKATNSAIASLNDEVSFACVMAERTMLSTLQGGCLSPIGAATSVENDRIMLTGVVLTPNGSNRIVETDSGPLENWMQIGVSVADKLIRAGANDLQ
jgi:hydroxymethylbilane synthase